MNLEEYRKVKDYENYEISNFGNIRNCKTNTIKKPSLNEKGYLIINLYKKNKQKIFKISRLVAFAFIPNDDITKIEIDHIDRIRTNNNVDNLRWATRKEQMLNQDYHHRKKDGLHNITISSYGTYYVEFQTYEKRVFKSFKSLEEAIVYRDEYILNNPR